MTSHYDALGVPRNADTATIRKAYKKKASKHHPDKGGKPEDMAAVNRAHDVLTDETLRVQYDQTGDDRPGRGLEQFVRACLMEFFNQAVDSAVVDIVGTVRRNMTQVIHNSDQSLATLQVNIERLNKKRGRVVSKGATNVYAELMNAKIGELEAAHLSGTQKLNVVKASLEALDDYATVMDEPSSAPSPTMQYVTYRTA